MINATQVKKRSIRIVSSLAKSGKREVIPMVLRNDVCLPCVPRAPADSMWSVHMSRESFDHF